MIEFKHIKKSFSKNMILSDVNLTIHEGELIRISGPNGCGKSTLLKIATHLLKPDEGTVLYTQYSDEIGALIENPCFIESETGLYNLKFLYNLKNKYDEDKVIKILNDFNLDYRLNMSVKKYSIGMRQKLGIIQAFMEDQKILYFDEPTRGLDKESVQHFCDLIHDLHQLKRTIVICSHEELNGIIFDKEYILKNGSLSQAT